MKRKICIAVMLAVSALIFADKHFETGLAQGSYFYYYFGDIYADDASYALDFDTFYKTMDSRAKKNTSRFILVSFDCVDAGVISALRSSDNEDAFEYIDASGCRAFLSFSDFANPNTKCFSTSEKKAYANAKDVFKVYLEYANSSQKKLLTQENFFSEIDEAAKNFKYQNAIIEVSKMQAFDVSGQYSLVYNCGVVNNDIVFSITYTYGEIYTILMCFSDKRADAQGPNVIFAKNYGTNYNEMKLDMKKQISLMTIK